MTTVFVRDVHPSILGQLIRGLKPEGINVVHIDKPLSRSVHLRNAFRGSILLSDHAEDKNSPMYFGGTGTPAHAVVSAVQWAVGRSKFYRETLPAKYIGRVYSRPVNILVGDAEGLDPRKYIDIFPDNWWGSCAYLESYEPRKLFTTLEMYLPNTKPVGVTDEAVTRLKAYNLDYVDATGYTLDLNGGLSFREATRRDTSYSATVEESDLGTE